MMSSHNGSSIKTEVTFPAINVTCNTKQSSQTSYSKAELCELNSYKNNKK